MRNLLFAAALAMTSGIAAAADLADFDAPGGTDLRSSVLALQDRSDEGGGSIAPAPAFAKIVGGVPAAEGEFPFIVSLQNSYNRHFCGGSLIRDNWVLTAAHCVDSGYLKYVVVGLHNQGQTAGAEKFGVRQTVKHPGWDPGTMTNDYALVQLSGKSGFPPIALNTRELSGAADLVTAGWGLTSEGGSGTSRTLRKVSVPLVSNEACGAAYPGSINDSMLCAGYRQGGKDACQGDSGGPLVIGAGPYRSLAGVVSWGEGCARPEKYGVYSKVSAAAAWIDSVAR